MGRQRDLIVATNEKKREETMRNIKRTPCEPLTKSNLTNLFLLTAAGGLLGVTAGLLLAPKSGKRLRQDLHDTYDNMTEKGAEYLDNARETATQWIGEEYPSNTHLAMGLIGGGILGAAAIYLLTRDEEESQSFAQRFRTLGRSASEKITSGDWVDTAREFLDQLRENGHPEETRAKFSESVQDGSNELLKWANIGLSIWQNLQKRG
jgi:hypothetical protein